MLPSLFQNSTQNHPSGTNCWNFSGRWQFRRCPGRHFGHVRRQIPINNLLHRTVGGCDPRLGLGLAPAQFLRSPRPCPCPPCNVVFAPAASFIRSFSETASSLGFRDLENIVFPYFGAHVLQTQCPQVTHVGAKVDLAGFYNVVSGKVNQHFMALFHILKHIFCKPSARK